jgi:hypothetical protein
MSSAALVIDSTLRAGKSAGFFANTASELEFKYAAFQNFRISGAAAFAYDVAGVTEIEDAGRAAIQSLSFDARFQMLGRAKAPFGLTLSVGPHWRLRAQRGPQSKNRTRPWKACRYRRQRRLSSL